MKKNKNLNTWWDRKAQVAGKVSVETPIPSPLHLLALSSRGR